VAKVRVERFGVRLPARGASARRATRRRQDHDRDDDEKDGGPGDWLHRQPPKAGRWIHERDAGDDQSPAVDQTPFERLVEHDHAHRYGDDRYDVGDERRLRRAEVSDDAVVEDVGEPRSDHTEQHDRQHDVRIEMNAARDRCADCERQ
jgi:hypothetical protein